MAKWEYLVRVFLCDKEDEVAVSYILQEYPDRDWKELPKYDLLSLEAWLNQCGAEGWELARLEGIDAVGKHGDLGFVFPPAYPAFRTKYLCVFKRPAAEP